MRKCGKCRKPGHNTKTCTESSVQKESLTLRDKGRLLLEEQRQKTDLDDVYENVPKKGLWIINPDRKKVYGKILQVKRTGSVLWESPLGAYTETTSDKLLSENYMFVDLEPRMLQWSTT